MNSNSVLLPDETHCRSELGGILYRERKAYAFSAEVLSVSEPESFFGHVEYEIGILVSERRAPPSCVHFRWSPSTPATTRAGGST